MKNTFKKVVFITTLLGLSIPAIQASSPLGIDTSAVETNFGFSNGIKIYAGGSLGYSTQDSGCNEVFFEGSCDDDDSSWKLFGGVRINPMFGAELAYIDQGTAELKGKAGSQQVASKNEITGYQVNGVGYLPIGSIPNLELLGKAGVMFWDRDTKTTKEGETEQSSDDGISPLLGLGMQYQLNQNIYLRGEWEHTFNTGSDSPHETDTDNYSLGVSYSTL